MASRPRVAMPWPLAAPAQQRVRDALRGPLRMGAVDLVLVGPTAQAGLSVAPSGAALGPCLAAAREAGQGACALLADDALAAAEALLVEGRVDALVQVEPPAATPALWVRDGVRVVDALPAAPWGPPRVEPARLADLLRRAGVLLRELGIARPSLGLLDVDGDAALAAAARAAAADDLRLLGPDPAEVAVRSGADALVGLIRPHVALPLELLGRGPTTGFPLEATHPVAWPREADVTALVVACNRVADLAAAPYAVDREQQRRAVSVTARSGRQPAASADRCPYCHRPLREGEPPAAPARCVTCGTQHHRDCVAEHGHCTVLGCPGVEVERLGARFEVARLGLEREVRAAFEPLEGDTSRGPAVVRVEAPVDDPDTPTRGRARLALELTTTEVARGGLVEGHVVVTSPRPFAIRGGLLRLTSTLTTQEIAADGTRRIPRPQRIVSREALWVGDTPAGALGRLSDGVAALFGGGEGRVAIPAGVRRWPFAFRLAADHPPTVANRFKDTEEAVSTRLEVVLDRDTSALELRVV